MIKSERQKPADENWWRKAKNKSTARPGKKCRVGTVCFGGCCGRGNGHGDEGFDQPDGEPSARHGLPRGRKRGHQGGNPHRHAAPAGHGGKFGGVLHRLADIAKVIGGASVDRDGLALRGAKWANVRHGRYSTSRS